MSGMSIVIIGTLRATDRVLTVHPVIRTPAPSSRTITDDAIADRRRALCVSPAIGTIPLPCLPVLSATSCSIQSAERLEALGQQQRQLVASCLRRSTHQCAEREARDSFAGSLARHASAMRRALRPAALQRHADQRGGHDAEQRQGRISATDVGRVDEHVEEALVQRAPVERRLIVGDRDEAGRPVLHACGFDTSPRRSSHRSSVRSSCPTCSR